ncbi:flagellar basal body-associated FliL family protein [Sedimenticola selenatireducens]|uniref:Flagellar protein FliL n=1 Tax=Sedimenticola selenatireducens TaxID=191960 RepID=A0A558DQ07_9GAMM|nr:flagellar basal body-associated FliL family protein [Sedimenticola selenatireducens]TVO70509.1 flagellar basal body protein FliL [Sedimenticola selenatireducens]TVT63086.1 MAG: flagellar basal body protein FliL [Sedimenticola selenatireducens]
MRLPSLRVILLFLILPLSLSAEEGKVEEAEVQPEVAVYHELSPSFVVNLQGKARYMRCDIQLMTRDEDQLANIALHAPALRHELLLLLSDQKGQDIKDSKGKEKLRKVALQAVQNVMKQMTNDESVVDLFFTSYFVE